jgi:hypothetical protein
MKRNWGLDELIEDFTLLPNEFATLGNKTGVTRLGFAIFLKFFQYNARFPVSKNEIPKDVINFIAKQLSIDNTLFEKYNWQGRSIKYHKARIREFFGFRESTKKDIQEMNEWLIEKALFYESDIEKLKELFYSRFREINVVPPSNDQVERVVKSVFNTYENNFFQDTYKKLKKDSILKMDFLIGKLVEDEENSDDSFNLSELQADPGRSSLETVFKEINKLKTINKLNLPIDLFKDVPEKILRKYRTKVIAEKLYELRRHPDQMRYSILAVFFWIRSREIADNLIELLILIIHRIGIRAEKKIDKELLKDFKRVNGKANLLFKMADAAIENPEGSVKEVIFPVVNENTLKELVKEFKNTGTIYKEKVYTVMRASYSHHYRRMVPEILNLLKFCSNNDVHRPVIEALELIKKYTNTDFNTHYFSDEDTVPIDGVIKTEMKKMIIEKDANEKDRINRINYEIVALQALRDKLRCKEIWVVGSSRYRNPEEDLPTNFEERREENYNALKQPLDSKEFIENIKRNMMNSLDKLNKNLPKNEKVKITFKGKKSNICITPFDPQPEPKNITKLKAEIMQQWPMTNLLDILKEADLRLNFTDEFKTAATHERLERNIIQIRLILALFGLGTNTGLKRISSGNHGENYQNLLYIRRKFINKDNLRNAIAKVVNAILESRIYDIWGTATTTCASDAKKFGAWDQNLMTEWSIRYRGRGIMIYWHVEKKSVCIYSQLKTCSSSEVAAMIEGLLKHCTDTEIEKNFVDSRGQSEVGFAFCHLLGFNLMPRLKGINKQKLYRPDKNMNDEYDNLGLSALRAGHR